MKPFMECLRCGEIEKTIPKRTVSEKQTQPAVWESNIESAMANVSCNTTGPEKEILPDAPRITFITLGILYTVIGLPGNVLTIAAIVKMKPLRSRLNMFIVNLCVTDIIAVGYLYPFVILDLILGYRPVSLPWCQVNLIVFNLTLPTTYLTILLIAFSRYLKFLHEVRFERYFTKNRTILYCLTTWIPGIVLALFNVSNISAVHYTRRSRMCFVHCNKFKFGKWLGSPIILISFACVVCFYWRIGLKLNKYALELRSQGNETLSKIRLDASRRLTLMTFLIFVIYIFMTMPLFVMLSSGLQSSSWVHVMTLSLYFGNSSVNCVVYGAAHRRIRQYYKKLIPVVWFVRVHPAPMGR